MPSLTNALAAVADARVFAVDDNPANTSLLKRLLQRSGLPDVVEVHDPTMVIDMLDERGADLVLLDLRMPGMDGFEVLAQIQQWAAGTFLPVIVVSSDDSRRSVERALGMGAHDFLSKPVEVGELVLRVRNLLLHRRAYQELRRSRAWLRTRLDLFEPGLARVDADPGWARQELRRVLDQHLLRIALQPVIDLRDGSQVSAEALARFPAAGIGDTSEWLGAAMEVGMGVEVETAAALAALALLPTLPAGISLAVNVSPVLVLADLMACLGDAPWHRVVLELIEHAPVEDYSVLNRMLAPVREAGARLAVDDTGAGFASLRHILDVRPDFIKLDIGIVRGVDHDLSRAAVSEMMVRFAERVGIQLIAEGIETQGECDTLRELGVVFGQGYLLGRPAIVGGTLGDPVPLR